MQHVQEHGSWRGRYQQRRADGSEFWADTFISLVTDDRGNPCGFVGIDRDVTAHKHAEDALRQSEARFRELTEHIQEVFWVSDLREPQASYISPMYEKVWGRSRESLYRNPFSFLDAVHPEAVRAAAAE